MTDVREEGKILEFSSQFAAAQRPDLDMNKAKYEAETHHAGVKQRFITQEKAANRLSFLEYAETRVAHRA